MVRSALAAPQARQAFRGVARCLPPFLTHALRYVLSDWKYRPEGWSTEDPLGKGWNDESVAQAQERHWPALLGNLQGPGPLGVSHLPTSMSRDHRGDHNSVMSFAYVLALASRKKDRLSVLDWGGGLGHYYLYSRALAPEVSLEYHCHDLPGLCRLGRKLLPEVEFHESAADLFGRQYDLAISSSSLHYFQDWETVACQLASAAGEFLYVARLQTVLRGPSFVVVQRPYPCGYHTQYPSWFLNRDQFLSRVQKSGMELLREFVFAEDWLVRGAPEKGESRGYLFRRPLR